MPLHQPWNYERNHSEEFGLCFQYISYKHSIPIETTLIVVIMSYIWWLFETKQGFPCLYSDKLFASLKWTASSEFGSYRLCEQRRFSPRSLARTSAARSYKQWVKRNLQTESQTLAPLNGWACAVKICNDGMLEDTNSFDGAQMCQR